MARVSYKKILFKAISSLLGLLLIVYLICLWKLKTGVDAFLDSRPADLGFDYQWLAADLQGNLYLKGVELFSRDYERLIKAKWVSINFGSMGALWSLNENVIYQKIPTTIRIDVADAKTAKRQNFFQTFNFLRLPFNDSLLPADCVTFLNSPDAFAFSLNGELSYQENDEILDFNLEMQSRSFSNINLTGRLDNVASENLHNGYLSQLNFTANNLVWLQQALNQCRQKIELTENGQLASHIVKRFRALARTSNYWLDSEFTEQLAAFVRLPEKFNFQYSPLAGKTWSQLRNLPLDVIAEQAEFSLSLNDAKVAAIINRAKLIGTTGSDQAQTLQALPTPSQTYLTVSYVGLSNFVGTRVTLYLKNRSAIKGLIKKVTKDRLILNEYQFGGYSELPYHYNDIESIEVNDAK